MHVIQNTINDVVIFADFVGTWRHGIMGYFHVVGLIDLRLIDLLSRKFFYRVSLLSNNGVHSGVS